MNRLLFTCVVICQLACGSKPPILTEEKAMKIAAEELGYPNDVIYTMKLADPKEAEKCLKLRLDSMGWVRVKAPKDLKYPGQPIITFTEKAELFLMPATPNDIYTNIRRIKIGRKTLKTMSEIKEYGKEAGATAIMSFTDFNPLSILSPEYKTKLEELSLTFVQTNTGWSLLTYVR